MSFDDRRSIVRSERNTAHPFLSLSPFFTVLSISFVRSFVRFVRFFFSRYISLNSNSQLSACMLVGWLIVLSIYKNHFTLIKSAVRSMSVRPFPSLSYTPLALSLASCVSAVLCSLASIVESFHRSTPSFILSFVRIQSNICYLNAHSFIPFHHSFCTHNSVHPFVRSFDTHPFGVCSSHAFLSSPNRPVFRSSFCDSIGCGASCH